MEKLTFTRANGAQVKALERDIVLSETCVCACACMGARLGPSVSHYGLIYRPLAE